MSRIDKISYKIECIKFEKLIGKMLLITALIMAGIYCIGVIGGQDVLLYRL